LGSSVVSYTRENPSPRYRALVGEYQRMHREGIPERGIAPAKLYVGRSLLPHLPAVRALARQTGAQSLLDYGAGKGLVWRDRGIRLKSGETISNVQEYLGLDRVACYDPAVPENASFPAGRFDGVICIDVLEHCAEADIPWIVAEIFAAADKFVFANVASYPAKKDLPSGENAHCTQREPKWWQGLLRRVSARHPGVKYLFEITEDRSGPLGRLLGRRRVTRLAN
jgi:hypothetical protein